MSGNNSELEVSNSNTPVRNNAQTDMMIARQAQEVQVAMLAAKRFPRDELEAMNRIKATCQRPTLAEQAIYTYPRGGQKVTGPSIRLAEAIAQSWGNLDTGVIELGNNNGRSEMMAYAWDLETNTRVTKTFSVEHKRDTKQGRKDLTDGRDIYEATANFAARRMRACILSVVPGDVVEMAVEESRKALASSDKRPVEEILASLLDAFKEIGITKEQLEKYLGKQLTNALKEDLIDLRGVFKAIKDGQSKAVDFFPDPKAAEDEKARTRASIQKSIDKARNLENAGN